MPIYDYFDKNKIENIREKKAEASGLKKKEKQLAGLLKYNSIELVKSSSFPCPGAGMTRNSPDGWPATLVSPFLNLTFLLKASSFQHFRTVKVYSPNICLWYI